jgi:hypothetical protein
MFHNKSKTRAEGDALQRVQSRKRRDELRVLGVVGLENTNEQSEGVVELNNF